MFRYMVYATNIHTNEVVGLSVIFMPEEKALIEAVAVARSLRALDSSNRAATHKDVWVQDLTTKKKVWDGNSES
jgi:hypothetical protein